MSVLDRLQRPLRSLRVSVTDRCNLRCEYCMPEEDYTWLPRADLLEATEIERIVRVFVRLGVERLRLTGGEPLLRPDVADIIRRLSHIDGLRDLALTTNGVLLAEHASELRAAGLQRVTVSLDTLRADRFVALSRRDLHGRVLEGIGAARAAGLPLKIDSVLVAGTNDDEVIDLLELGRRTNAEVRFIEYMDVAGATRWTMDRVVPRARVLETIRRHYGPIEHAHREPSAPADRYVLPDGTPFGIIASTTEPFCRDCDRSRLSADGVWFRCLYALEGTDLRTPMRSGGSDETLLEMISEGWRARSDRGAEERRGLPERHAFVAVETLRKRPHLEMHTRGG